jgi:hypothetical protein
LAKEFPGVGSRCRAKRAPSLYTARSNARQRRTATRCYDGGINLFNSVSDQDYFGGYDAHAGRCNCHRDGKTLLEFIFPSSHRLIQYLESRIHLTQTPCVLTEYSPQALASASTLPHTSNQATKSASVSRGSARLRIAWRKQKRQMRRSHAYNGMVLAAWAYQILREVPLKHETILP